MISRYRHEHGLSTVKNDPQLTAIAERQAKAMAASGIMDHNVAGSFTTRMSGVHTGMAGENIAAGSKTWAQTLRMWQASPGHNAPIGCFGPMRLSGALSNRGGSDGTTRHPYRQAPRRLGSPPPIRGEACSARTR